MALISEDTRRRAIHALGSPVAGGELCDKLNLADAAATQDLFAIVALIVATNVSATIDFGGLVVGDKILISPAAAGNSMFVTCAVAGTLPQAAVVGSLYVVLRAFAAPTAVSQKL